MKTIKRFFPALLAFIIILSSALPAFADSMDDNDSLPFSSSYYPYDITNYDIKMNVLENNTLQITEKIDVHFNEERHGIYRTIPTKMNVMRTDGTSGKINALVKHVNVYNESSDNSYTIETGGGKYTIKIGDADIYLIGNESYTISYDYVMGEDINSGFDELYFNLIGSEWETNIEKVTFEINMPKEFDPELLGFSTGKYGTAGTNNVHYTIDGNKISGYVSAPLHEYEAFTVRLQLPEGYFYFNKAAYYAKLAAMPAVSAAVLIIVFILWFKFGRDKKVVEVVEFYPPKGMSSADVAFWSKGMVTNDDLIALLIELANEGYVEIEEINEKSFFGKSDKMKITKLKETYTGHDKAKHKFFNGLFKGTNNNYVYDTDLQNSFYKTLNAISTTYNSTKNRNQVFNSKSTSFVLLGAFLSVASFALNIIISINTISSAAKLYFLIPGLIIAAASFVLSCFIRQRTNEGHENLQKIKGFKLFLETAEKEKLETLVEEDPKYFYDILPYAYVLGVSDEWIYKFKNIAFEPADWYRGNTMMSYMVYSHFLNSTLSSAKSNMVSSPQSSGGSGFSGGGGGFSGGGAGGGGGGSW